MPEVRMQPETMMHVARAALVVFCLLSPAAARDAARPAACRAACSDAIEGCIAWRSTALRDLEAPPRVVRRKAKRIRRSCAKAAVKQCRAEGVAACDTPVLCACGR
jgi:hypothetical protein